MGMMTDKGIVSFQLCVVWIRSLCGWGVGDLRESKVKGIISTTCIINSSVIRSMEVGGCFDHRVPRTYWAASMS